MIVFPVIRRSGSGLPSSIREEEAFGLPTGVPGNARHAAPLICPSGATLRGSGLGYVSACTVREEEGEDEQCRCGFEPVKALIRGLPLPQPRSFQGCLGGYHPHCGSGPDAQGLGLAETAGVQGVVAVGLAKAVGVQGEGCEARHDPRPEW